MGLLVVLIGIDQVFNTKKLHDRYRSMNISLMQTSNDGSVLCLILILNRSNNYYMMFQKYSSFEYTANCIYELDRLIKSMKNIWIIVVRFSIKIQNQH
jgi:hypothetical protein